MNWKILDNEATLNKIIADSHEKPQAIFKHSTTCSISAAAKGRLDSNNSSNIDYYYLDLLNNRNLSNLIAEKFHVRHESPQILLIKNGNCTYHESHIGIRFASVESEG